MEPGFRTIRGGRIRGKSTSASCGNWGGSDTAARPPQPRRAQLRLFWTRARTKLVRPPYFINERTRPVVAQAFGEVASRLNLTVPVCAIMNDHVHVLVMRSRYRIEYVVNQLKGAATHALALAKTPWARGCWKVFLGNEDAVAAAAEYIEANPPAAGLPPQHWDFVTPLPPGYPAAAPD